MKSNTHVWVIGVSESLGDEFPKIPGLARYEIVLFQGEDGTEKNLLLNLFNKNTSFHSWQMFVQGVGGFSKAVLRSFHPRVIPPKLQSLHVCLELESPLFELHKRVKVVEIAFFKEDPQPSQLEPILRLWREPAIETCKLFQGSQTNELYEAIWSSDSRDANSVDNSAEALSFTSELGLEFSSEELSAIQKYETERRSLLTRSEYEVIAQSWSEHCKHKIFGAQINHPDGTQVPSLFQTFIRKPTLEMLSSTKKNLALSVFEDNAGVLALLDEKGQPTPWAYCIKMETHNSPSALSPRAGAATGVVGVLRDILGTGLGARPVGCWNALGFESTDSNGPRPPNALSPQTVRLGVIAGIEEGGNQSGVPTIMGSVCFDHRFSVKPYVFAGAIGILPKSRVQKNNKSGDVLYIVGGETGADGLRGAVMSSRDLRDSDFTGSAVQMAQAFVQKRMSEFLLLASERGLITGVTDNGAGGISSSVGEMAQSTGGAKIDLTDLRLKFLGLKSWEKLLSESQERMTVSVRNTVEFEKLAKEWQIAWDRLGELNSSGDFEVWDQGRCIVKLSLEFLHKGCPKLRLNCTWDKNQERETLKLEAESRVYASDLSFEKKFERFLGTEEMCSRAEIVRRFDHEVGGRTLQKPFTGEFQSSPSDGAILEIYDAHPQKAGVALGHGWVTHLPDIELTTAWALDEALRQILIAGGDLSTAGIMDNYAWPDPTDPSHSRRLWRLGRSVELLSQLAGIHGVPFVSGKDSLKNNSKDFAAPEVVVVTGAASVKEFSTVPQSCFSKANDVVLWIPGLALNWQDSMWVKKGLQSESTSSQLRPLTGQDYLNSARESVKIFKSLFDLRVLGKIKAWKDLSEGGLGTCLFEMCLGFKKGIYFERSYYLDEIVLFQERLSSFVLCVDPHYVHEVCEKIPTVERVGVVMAPFEWRYADSNTVVDIKPFERAYQAPGRQKGFWGGLYG
jgi:phosphoribosylformylglycinamidine (FGAM) synthase-like enzyme